MKSLRVQGLKVEGLGSAESSWLETSGVIVDYDNPDETWKSTDAAKNCSSPKFPKQGDRDIDPPKYYNPYYGDS